jgi:hypothetical protein
VEDPRAGGQLVDEDHNERLGHEDRGAGEPSQTLGFAA